MLVCVLLLLLLQAGVDAAVGGTGRLLRLLGGHSGEPRLTGVCSWCVWGGREREAYALRRGELVLVGQGRLRVAHLGVCREGRAGTGTACMEPEA